MSIIQALDAIAVTPQGKKDLEEESYCTFCKSIVGKGPEYGPCLSMEEALKKCPHTMAEMQEASHGA